MGMSTDRSVRFERLSWAESHCLIGVRGDMVMVGRRKSCNCQLNFA